MIKFSAFESKVAHFLTNIAPMYYIIASHTFFYFSQLTPVDYMHNLHPIVFICSSIQYCMSVSQEDTTYQLIMN